MSKIRCPGCGDHLHRSHARGLDEKLVRLITPYRTYRCHTCGWRGWVSSSRPLFRLALGHSFFRTLVGFILALALTLAFIYLAKVT